MPLLPFALPCLLVSLFVCFATGTAMPGGGVAVRIAVSDSAEHTPIELARVILRRGNAARARGMTNAAGRVAFPGVEPGTYGLTVWSIGYAMFADSIAIDPDHTVFAIRLAPQPSQQRDVEISAGRAQDVSSIDLATGNQTFEAETYHAAPAAQMTTLIQQNVMGAARAPTGEVHIRGQHGEYSYYIDGIPVPLGVFGGLNEVVDPNVIDQATFLTGGFPAEYGGQMSAIIDLRNRVPTGAFHLETSTFAGSYLVFNGAKPFAAGMEVPSGRSGAAPGDTLGGRVGPFRALNSDGQALSMSDHTGNLGMFISGSRRESDRRIDTPIPNLYHDHGFDYFLYGKFDYLLSDADYVTANLNFGRTYTQIPYDPVVQIQSDLQNTTNAFQTLSYFRSLNTSEDHTSNLFVGVYAREGELGYEAGSIDEPDFTFGGDTTNSYILSENRSFTTIGARATIDQRITDDILFKSGFNASSTTGTEDFTSMDSLMNAGPEILTHFAGSDAGGFSQTEWHPTTWTSLETGIRYDQHIAPDIALQSQWSPRLRWNFFPDENIPAYLYYGRLFMPTNVEGLRSIARNFSSSTTPAYPERDNFYEAVYTRSFPFGVRGKFATFFKRASPFTDDATLGSSAIKTPFNIATVRTTGIEFSASFSDASTPFSGHVNSSIIHAVGSGALTGGFLPPGSDGAATDLDHDQRLSVAAGINYQPADWFANLNATYGSGLSNGFPGRVASYGTGLFDFNQAAHTTPYWILDAGAGHTFHTGGNASIEPSVYITNLLDHIHLLKGAYTTGASWEEPMNVVLKLAYRM